MQAIVLAGGLGTRLRSVVSDLPKPMAPIGERPFLEYVLKYLKKHGVSKVVLSTGYKHEIIEEYFGNSFTGMELCYSIEDEPLGTGGAIKKAFTFVNTENVFIINGDTYFNVDLKKLLATHNSLKADLTLSLKHMISADRYGTVALDNNRVVKFKEKAQNSSGFINGGIYCASQDLFDGHILPEKFSFEIDFLSKYIKSLNIGPYKSDDYFIDIGIPEDYVRAQLELERNI